MNNETFIQSELIKNELNQLDLQYQAIKEQKYNELLRENKQLKESKRKAIEYIECALSEDKETPTKYEDWRLDLLEILKGESNE